MVSITVQFNFSYALSFRFLSLWQLLVENRARSQEIYKLLEAEPNRDVVLVGSEVIESLKQLLVQVRQDLLGCGDRA